jgi:hypothetical protein
MGFCTPAGNLSLPTYPVRDVGCRSAFDDDNRTLTLIFGRSRPER